MGFARIAIPPRVARGDAFEVRVSIRHPMETGFRVDDVGASIPRNTLRDVVVRYGAVRLVQPACPVGDHFVHRRGSRDAQREIDVRPAILAAECRRAGVRRADDACVVSRRGDQ